MYKKQHYVYSGKLVYNDDAEFELQSPAGTVNISNILHKICCSDDSYIEIKIMDRCKVLFDECGSLKLSYNPNNGLDDYHVDVFNLEDVLFNNTEKLLEITIFANALNQQGDVTYEKRYFRKK